MISTMLKIESHFKAQWQSFFLPEVVVIRNLKPLIQHVEIQFKSVSFKIFNALFVCG